MLLFEIVNLIAILYTESLSSPPEPPDTFRSCYENNQLCFETNISKTYDGTTISKNLNQFCPPSKVWPQVFREAEQKSLVQFLTTLPQSVNYIVPLGLEMRYEQWNHIIMEGYSSLSDDKYFVTIVDKKSNDIDYELEAVDYSVEYPFVCVAEGPCEPPKPSQNVTNIDKGCLIFVITKLSYYDSKNYCLNEFNGFMLGYDVILRYKKLFYKNLPKEMPKIWLRDSRLVLLWQNNVLLEYSQWASGDPKSDSVFTYVKNNDDEGKWFTYQASDDQSEDEGYKYTIVCMDRGVLDEAIPYKSNDKVTQPLLTLRTKKSSDTEYDKVSIVPFLTKETKSGLGLGLGLGIGIGLISISCLIAVIVLCTRMKNNRNRDTRPRKLPSVSTVSASIPADFARNSSVIANESRYNNYLDSNNLNTNRNLNNNNNLDNYDFQYERETFVKNSLRNSQYKDTRSYEVPNCSPIVEHVYNSIRQPRQSQPPLPPLSHQLPPQSQLCHQSGQPQRQMQQPPLQMIRNSYLDIIG